METAAERVETASESVETVILWFLVAHRGTGSTAVPMSVQAAESNHILCQHCKQRWNIECRSTKVNSKVT